MPIGNNFQHSIYSRADPGERLIFREVLSGAPPDSPAWYDAMAGFGTQLRQHGVRAIIFLHGSVLNSDLFGIQRLDEVGGLKRGYSRGISGLDALLSLMRRGDNGLPIVPDAPAPPFGDDASTQAFLDTHAGDGSNFTRSSVEMFTKAVNGSSSQRIHVIRTLWSSEHHHLGRALAAVRLLHQLDALGRQHDIGAGQRILIEAHGHAGLVLALASNLLAPGPSSGRSYLLRTLKDHAKQTTGSVADIEAVEERLSIAERLNGAILDVVTFGTPVRYGWDPSGLGRMLHIVNHRPMRLDEKRWLAKMELPQILMEMPIAWGGDYVQQLAVAGSDAVPPTPEARAANKLLWELLEPYEGFERWLECARKGVRCQNDGRCLLVDYKDSGSSQSQDHLYGHAAYTRLNAMLFNTTEIANTLYPSASS